MKRGFLLLAALLIGCGDDAVLPDAVEPIDATEATDTATRDPAPLDAFETADDVAPESPAGPVDLSLRLPAGQVRAGRVEKAEDTIGGRTAKGRAGDWKLYNSKVAFIVQDVGIHSFYKRYGGLPIDADVVRPDGQPGGSDFGDLFFGWNLRLFEPDAIEVVNDGRDGARAVVRARGHDGDFPWLASFYGDLVPADSLGLDLTFEYSLGSDDEFLTMTVTTRNDSGAEVDLTTLAAGFIMGDGLKTHFPGPGFDAAHHLGEFPGWAAMGDDVSYGLLADDGPLDMILYDSGVSVGNYGTASLDAGASMTRTRYLAVTAGGIDDAWRILHAVHGGVAAGRVRGQVTADADALARGVRVHVVDAAGNHLSTLRADAAGRFDGELEVGPVQVIAKADGFVPSPAIDVDVVAGQIAQVAPVLPPATRFAYHVTSPGVTGNVPAKIWFFRQDAAAPNLMPAMFGEESYAFGAGVVIWSGTGEGTGVLPRGTWNAVVTRGPEYERASQDLEAGATDLDLAFDIARVVDSSGFLSGDFHIHHQASPDSDISRDFRVRTALAEGLELMIVTDHDAIADLQPDVLAIPGASAWMQAIPGSEVTTYVYGHFNAWPLTAKPDQVNGGGIFWFGVQAPELFANIRASEAHPVILQVNHPRSPDYNGYFNKVGLDRAAGTYADAGLWSTDLDAVEAFNGGCGNGGPQAKLDWFDFLDRGYPVAVNEGSDAHSQEGVGMPRAYVQTDHDPATFDPQELVTAYKSMRTFVSCGPFVRFSIGGHGMGETLTDAGPLKAEVEIQAPSWMELADFRILRRGQPVFSLAAADWGAAQGALRFHDTVDLTAAPEDSWYVLEVTGTGNQKPWSDEPPYAITNPVFVDVDGNGTYDAPLPKYVQAL